MQGHGEKLTRKQEQAIAALLTEQTIAVAAEKIGVNEVTLRRWLQAARVPGRIPRSTLLKLLGSNSDSITLRAATAILDHASKGVELIDFEEHLSALEQQADLSGGRSR